MSEKPRGLAVGFQLLHDLANGQASVSDVDRFYAAAAEASERSPEAARQLEQIADNMARRAADRRP